MPLPGATRAVAVLGLSLSSLKPETVFDAGSGLV
jgi:hypothetical protein